jgi:predicted N-formylglutamate amidohydrolase
MVRLGVAETIVGRVLNHAAQGVTAKVYALHSYAPEKRGALDCWAADIQREIDGRPSQNLAAVGSEDRQ